MSGLDATAPLRPRLPAWIPTLGLLVVVTFLAGVSTWSHRTVKLGPRVTLPGWEISFRPPVDWFLAPDEGLAFESTRLFLEPGRLRRRRHLHALRLGQESSGSATTLAVECVRWWVYPGRRLLLAPMDPNIHLAPFGPLEGAWIRDGGAGIVVAAGVSEDAGYCLGVSAPGLSTDREVGILEAVARSIEHADP